MKIRYVAQRRKTDCIIACLAMILNISLDNIEANFFTDFDSDKGGLKIDQTIDYLIDCGWFVIRKEGYGAINITQSRKELWKPFAPIHLVKVKQWADRPTTHAIIMTSNGKIYDPGDKKYIKKNYYEVLTVLGCFPPNPKELLVRK